MGRYFAFGPFAEAMIEAFNLELKSIVRNAPLLSESSYTYNVVQGVTGGAINAAATDSSATELSLWRCKIDYCSANSATATTNVRSHNN